MFSYHRTSHSTTGVSPAQLLIGQNPKSRLDLLKPDISQRVEVKQQQQKSTHDSHAQARPFSEGEEVYTRNFQQSGKPWIPGKISKATGPVSYQVMLEGGQIVRRHQDHARKRMAASEVLSVPSLDISPELNTTPQTEPETENNTENKSTNTNTETTNNPRVVGDILLTHVNLLIDMNRT